MRSLDKVIEKIESAWVCPSSDEAAEFCELIEIREEALHYLKELKEVRGTLATAREDAWKEIENFKQIILKEIADNPELTWEELRKMQDKPVWWMHGDAGEWLTIYRVPTLGNGNDNVIYATTCSGVECWIWKKDLDKFQYYKKERKDDTG